MKLNAIRAWKDEAYRSSLSEAELSMLPESPVGELELSETELEAVHGAGGAGDPKVELNSNGFLSCVNVLNTLAVNVLGGILGGNSQCETSNNN